MVPHLPLAVVPLHRGRARGSPRRDDPARVGDITHLDRPDAEAAVELHRILKLCFVIRDIAVGFVMADQGDALLARIVGDRFQVEVGRWLREVERPAVPAGVPPLDEHAAETMLRGEIDILPGARGGRAMIRPLAPTPRPADHAPPDADIFHRLHPAHIAELVRFVEIEFEVACHKPRCIVGDADRAPGRCEGQIAGHARPVRRRRQRRTKLAPLGALEPHRRIIDERRFVKRQMRAVVEAHRDRCMRGCDAVDRRLLVNLLVAIPLPAGDPPGGAG